jgi:hypothetical protein
MLRKPWGPAVTGASGAGAGLALLLLSACASGPPPAPAPGLDGSGPSGELNMFISPAGKPYRGQRGEPYPSAVWFAQADKDHDGRLSREEFWADSEAFFHQLDTDHNGVVDGFEIAAYEQSLPEILPRVRALVAGEGMDQSLGQSGRNGGGRLGEGPRIRGNGDGRQGAGLFSFIDQPEPVTAADTDFNGRVTLQEARAAADRRFDILDKNTDGFITLAELPKTPVQVFAERQAAQRAKRAGGRAPAPGR